MNPQESFNWALQALRGPERSMAIATLSKLAEQRHVPATFAYADALLDDSPSASYEYLTDKFLQGLIGAAYRAVLNKVFFSADAPDSADIAWLNAEANKANIEALLVLLMMSENTDYYNYYVNQLWTIAPDTATQLNLPRSVAKQSEVGEVAFPEILNNYNKNRVLKPTLEMKDVGIALYQNVFSPMICRHFVLKFNPHMQPSLIFDPISGEGKPNSVRTSTYLQVSGAHIDWFSLEVEKRLASLSGLPASQGEPLSVLKYEQYQQYKPHYDAFVGNDAALHEMQKDGGQRIKTQICYLQPAEEGGETAFLRKGLTVNPPAGSVLMFDNVDDDLNVLTASYHAGMPVVKGTKWIMTKWIRAETTHYGHSIYTLKRK
ncbi:2OG-Fe(II) oxygenase [Aestuariibacter sp. GS-14]|nr:2OG-Fe(II) oxygenase [Aestuariibacter sp. GS-14]